MGVAGVAFDPFVVDDVALGQIQQFLPQVGVQSGGFVRLFPAPGAPAFGPALFQAVDDIFGIAAQGDLAGLLQLFQRRDEGRQLHAVVGGLGFAAAQLLFVLLVAQHRAPAPRAGIAAAGAVGENFDLFHGLLRPAAPRRRGGCSYYTRFAPGGQGRAAGIPRRFFVYTVVRQPTLFVDNNRYSAV